MSIVGNIISDFSQGDDLEISCTIQSISSGILLSKVWFMVKRKFIDSDDDAIVSKLATSVFDGTNGFISDTGSDGTGQASVYLSNADTALFEPYVEYVYSLKALFDNDTVRTLETGIIAAFPTARQGIT
jgi:hypothetical protein